MKKSGAGKVKVAATPAIKKPVKQAEGISQASTASKLSDKKSQSTAPVKKTTKTKQAADTS